MNLPLISSSSTPPEDRTCLWRNDAGQWLRWLPERRAWVIDDQVSAACAFERRLAEEACDVILDQVYMTP